MNRLPAGQRRLSPRARTALTYAISALLTVAFLIIASRGVDLAKLRDELQRADYVWMFPSVGSVLLSHLVRAWRWRYLLDPVKPGIPLRHLFSGVMVGYLMNNMLPRAGELVRPYALGKLAAVSKSAAFGTIVVERLMDIVSFLILLALVPVFYNGPLLEAFPWLTGAGLLLSAATIALLGLLFALMVRRDWTDRFVGALGRIVPPTFTIRLGRFVHSFLDGLLFLKRPRTFWKIVLLSAVIWMLYVGMIYMAFRAFGLQQHLGLRAALVVETISSIGVAIPTPGATGGFHAFVTQTLTKLFFVDPAVALSYATATHAAGYIGVTLVGLYYLWKDGIKISEVTKEE